MSYFIIHIFVSQHGVQHFHYAYIWVKCTILVIAIDKESACSVYQSSHLNHVTSILNCLRCRLNHDGPYYLIAWYMLTMLDSCWRLMSMITVWSVLGIVSTYCINNVNISSLLYRYYGDAVLIFELDGYNRLSHASVFTGHDWRVD